MTSWLPIPADSDFTLANIPFGIFNLPAAPPRPAIAIGDHLLDLHVFALGGGFDALPEAAGFLSVFSAPTLNAFAALGQAANARVRAYMQDVLRADGPHAELLERRSELRSLVLHRRDEAGLRMRLPMDVGDYTDFYAGRVHAFTVGSLFRGPENALQANYECLPVGYHGRASSVVVSGEEVRRPWGQTGAGQFGPCARLDIELELAAFVGVGTARGEALDTGAAAANIFGLVLMNDWSGGFASARPAGNGVLMRVVGSSGCPGV